MKLRYIITSAVTIVIAFMVGLAENIFHVSSGIALLKILSNMFFVSGVLIFGVGGIVWCTNKGTFRIFGYTGKCFLLLFQTSDKKIANRQSFPDYCEEKDKKNKPFAHFLLIGLAAICLGLIFFVIYTVIQ